MNLLREIQKARLGTWALPHGKDSDTPTPPDPYKVADATTASNDQTAAFNKSLNLNNYSNPFGSQQSTQTGTDPTTGAPIYGTTISGNSQIQQQLAALLGQTGQSGGINQDALAGLQGLNGQYGGINSALAGLGGQYQALGSQLNQGQAAAAGQKGQDAAYAAQTQYLDPQFAQGQSSIQSQLANQGLSPGSEAYNNAMTNFNNSKQQAYSNAQNQSILTGSQIGAQDLQNQESGINTQAGLFNAQAGLLGQQAGNLGQQANNYGQQSALSQIPYQDLGSLASLIPGYSGTAGSSAGQSNIGQAFQNQYQGQLNSANADTASDNSTMSGVFAVGSALAIAF